MLTKKEAELIYIKIVHELEDESDDQYGYSRVAQYLDKFTEKPKREIQIGDIYFSRNGRIIKIEVECDGYETRPIFRDQDGWTYNRLGIRLFCDDRRYDLDLSTYYQLVAINAPV